MSRIVLAFAFVLVGCTTSPESSSHEEKLGDTACTAEGTQCFYSSQCCSGYCDSIGGYTIGHCAAPLPNGSLCTLDSECQSNICRNNECASASCEADGASCYASSWCCSGYCNNPGDYSGGKCEPPLAEGAFCWENGECQSKVCYNYQCSPLGCFSDGGTCSWHGECCSGYCDGAHLYSGGQCAVPQASGSYCVSNNECLSRNCFQNRCEQ